MCGPIFSIRKMCFRSQGWHLDGTVPASRIGVKAPEHCVTWKPVTWNDRTKWLTVSGKSSKARMIPTLVVSSVRSRISTSVSKEESRPSTSTRSFGV
ncbi:MAG: hypothetical protein ACUVYA_02590 [Planctomycetota bacterium]